MELHEKRENYSGNELTIQNTPNSPIDFLKEWLEFSIDQKIYDATAVTLATVSAESKPSARIVLLKEVNSQGVLFFTNYESRKGKDIDANPYACMVLFWSTLHRQIRMEGKVTKVGRKKSEEYFIARPLGSQRSAIISPQSRTIESKETLLSDVKKLEEASDADELICPSYWGGYLLEITYFEFWQGQRSRLHDRICYRLLETKWKKEMLAP